METTPNTDPAIKSGIARVILFLVASLIVCSIIQVIFTTLQSKGFLYRSYTDDSDIGSILQSFTFTKIGVVLCAWLFMKYINNKSFSMLGFSSKSFATNAYTGFFLALGILVIGTFILLFNNNIYYTKTNFDSRNLLLSILLFISVAFIEEIAIRGYVLNNLMQSMNKWLALSISAIIFSLLHLGNDGFTTLAFVNVFIAGILLGINYIYTKNLWFSIFFHFSWNIFQGSILGYKVSGIAFKSLFQQVQQGSITLTGGSFGFEGSLISALLQLLAIGGLVWFYEQRKNGFKLKSKTD